MCAQRDIPEKETLEVEFKSDIKCLPDSEIIDTIVALSNTEGGRLYLGVEDAGVPTGVHKNHEDTTRLSAFIANKTVPPVPARVSTIRLSKEGCIDSGGVDVTVIEVPRSIAVVSSSDGKIMRRRIKADGSPESVPLFPHEIPTRLSTLGRLDYSAMPVPDTTIDDFSKEEIQRLRTLLGRNRNSDRALLELDDAEMLKALQMTTVVDEKDTPTVTGILLAGTPDIIKKTTPTSEATFQVLEGTDIRVNQSFIQPLLYTIEKLRDLLEPWNPEREYTTGLFRSSVSEFDQRAFREALVNAFGHRDYTTLGRVRVLIDDEGMTISNPGGFIEGVTVKNLLTVEPHGRNPCLMDALKRIGLAERTGRGVDRIFEGSLVYGRPLPDYSNSTSTTVSVFIARSAVDETFMNMLEEEREKTGKPLSLRSLLVLNELKHQRRLSLVNLSEQLSLSETTTRATVEALVEAGIIEASGSAANRTYMLSSKVYAQNGSDIGFVRQSDIDKVRHPEMVLKLVGQKGSVSSKDIAELLHADRKQAYRVLSKLVDDGKLELHGRGRGAHYIAK